MENDIYYLKYDDGFDSMLWLNELRIHSCGHEFFFL